MSARFHLRWKPSSGSERRTKEGPPSQGPSRRMRRGPSAGEEGPSPKIRRSSSRRCLRTGAAILSGVASRRSP
eukprot:8217319-Pyramimonas_sp.AAC.1